jgi:Helicase HerA, central domain
MKTIIGIDRETKLEISIKDKERRKGVYLLGSTGQGKSSLLAHMILQDVKKDYAVIVLDPHGDLLNYVIALMPEACLKKTYLLDMTDSEFPFGLNLFTCSDPTDVVEQAIAVDQVMHIFAKHWPETRGILLEKLLRYIALTFLQYPGYSLADVPRLLWDDAFRSDIVSTLSNEQVKAYWQGEYAAMTLAERRKEIQALDNRLAAFNTTAMVRNIVGQQRNTIDIRRAIEEREVLLIRLPMEQMKDSAALIGTILLAQIHAATFAFGELDWDQRAGFSLYIDEFQNFATSDFAVLLKEGRKYGVRIIAAHQDRRDLPSEIRAATLTASTIGCFRPTPEDAAEMAPLLYDATVTLRPEHIFPDVLHRLRFHRRREVQEFFRDYVQPLQQQDHPRKDW